MLRLWQLHDSFPERGKLACPLPADGCFGKIYPFGRASPQLEYALKAVNEWFRTVAEGIYQHVAFTFGVIGFETKFTAVKAQALEAIPEARWDGLLIPHDDDLLWYPPTEFGPQFT